MSNYTQYFSDKSDDSALKKYFYLLVNKGMSEDSAWNILANVITGIEVSTSNDIKELLNAFKIDYDTQNKLAEDKRKEEALKFKNSLNPETLSKVKDMWKELNN